MNGKGFRKLFLIFTIALLLIQVLPLNIVAAELGKKEKFTDVDKYEDEIYQLVDLGIIQGFPNQKFKPNNDITRAQGVAMIIREMKLDTSNRPEPNFKDINSTYRFYKEIATAVDEGIIDGYKDGRFGPDDKMTRAQMAKILVGAYNLKLTESQIPNFKDVPATHWAYDYIRVLASNGITLGYHDQTFKPGISLTRLNFSLFLARYINEVKDGQQGKEQKDIKNMFTLKADQTEAYFAQTVNLKLEVDSKNTAEYKAEWKATGGKLTVAEDQKSATWRTEEHVEKNYNVTVTIEVTLPSGKKETFDKSVTISSIEPESSNTGGSSGGGTPKPETPLSIVVNQVAKDETYTTNEEQVTLTGKVDSTQKIKQITATRQSLTAETPSNITVEGTTEWSIKDIPLEIGTNNVYIKVKTASNQTYERHVVINRVNKTIEYADNVTTFDMKNDSDKKEVTEIANSIVNYWNDDMGTPDDHTDDMTVLLVKEQSPLVKSLKNKELASNDIVSIPPNDQFLTGWTFMIQDYGEPEDFIQYPSHLYEEIYVIEPGFADLFQGDISLDFSGGIDADDPVAFSIFPEGVNIIAESEDGEQTILTEDTQNSLFSIADSENPKPGMQWKEFKKLLKPTANTSNNNSGVDITIDFGGEDGVVLYDKDGKLKSTKNDQIRLSGQTGIKNFKTTSGIEWHPSLNPFNPDLLPQQLMYKTTYNKVNQIKAEFSAGLSMSDLVKEANKNLNAGFENKHQFLGMKLQGIDFKDQIAIGAIGLRLDIPPTYATLGAHQTTSKVVGFSPVLLIIPTVDISGKLEAKLAVTYAYNSYVETGFNIQKEGFTGAYGPLEANRGQQSYELPYDRHLEIYDIEGKSKSKKNEKPVPTLTVTGEGKAEASYGVGIMGALMLNGIIPAGVKASNFVRAQANLNGQAKWEGSSVPSVSGSGQLGLDAGVRLGVMAKLKADTVFGNHGFSRNYDWEYRLIDFHLSSLNISGSVKETDGDYDTSNNPMLSDVKVEARSVYSFNPFSNKLETTTDSNGKFKFNNIPSGKYKITFKKDGYVPYEEVVNVGASNVSVNVILDKAIPKKVTGKVLISDGDTDMSNNQPLSDVKISAKKVLASDSRRVETTTDGNGEYVIDGLSPGIYQITAKKSGFVTITQNVVFFNNQNSIRNLTLEMVAVSPEAINGTATGKVIDALTGNGINNITLNVRAGLNKKNGTIIKTIKTSTNGQYSVELPVGNYTLEAVGNDRLHTAYFNIKVEGSQTISNQNGIMTPIIPEGQIRTILRWGETPRDLDSHLVGPKADQSTDRFHIYYSNKTYNYNSIKYADLDVDDTSSWGPETTTIYQQTPGKYRFFIHDYTNRSAQSSMALASSGAMVEVYTSESASPVASFNVPYEEGTSWAVFEFDSETGDITPINQMFYGSTGSYTSYSNGRMRSLNQNSVESDLQLIIPSLLEKK